MTEKARAFYREIYQSTEYWAEQLMHIISDKDPNRSYLLRMDESEIEILKDLKLTPIQLAALKKVVAITNLEVAYGILCLIDGIVYSELELPDLSLIDRETGEELSSEYLHEEFIGLIEEME